MTEASATPVALVTGSRTGIGRRLSEFLLSAGYSVVGCSRRASEWSANGYTHIECDVTQERDVKALFREITQIHGRLDVAINNAGTASMNHFLLTPVTTVRSMLETHVVGTFLVSREAVLLMRKRKYGRILNVGTVAVPLRLAGEAAYVAAKQAVVGLSQVMAKEVAEFGITVNVVGPGPTPTELIHGVPKSKIDALIASLAVKRLSTFEDVWNVVQFFLRPESSSVTGQVVYLGGVPNN
ncbi:MAG TPA: SDR family oxidoreductase [Gemmatimonadaceae bacterium]